MRVSAIIVASGRSLRMGFDKIKASIKNRSILAYSMLAFEKCHQVDDIIVVTQNQNHDWVRDISQEENISKFLDSIDGGETRRDSVFNGILKVKSHNNYDPSQSLIAIHDSARPLITHKIINECISKAKIHGCVSLAKPIVDTVKRTNNEGIINKSIDRENLWAMETPQVFRSDILISAYDYVMKNNINITDEVSAVEKIDHLVYVLKNDKLNIKITFPEDLEIVSSIINNI